MELDEREEATNQNDDYGSKEVCPLRDSMRGNNVTSQNGAYEVNSIQRFEETSKPLAICSRYLHERPFRRFEPIVALEYTESSGDEMLQFWRSVPLLGLEKGKATDTNGDYSTALKRCTSFGT